MFRLLAFFSCLFLFLSTCAAEDTIGTIENSAGSAIVIRAAKILPASAGAVLQLNDIVRTEPGGLVRLVLTDGSAILVQQNTELRVIKFDTDKQQTFVELLHGRIQVDVNPYTKPTGRFTITTPTASILAIGTAVAVQTDSASLETTVNEAQLRDLPVNGRDVSGLTQLTPGTENQTNSTGQPARPTSLQDITPGALPGTNGFWIGDYPGVNTTYVAGLNHFVAVSSSNPSVSGLKFLLPGQSAAIGRERIVDFGTGLGGPIMKDKLWFWGSYGSSDTRTYALRDFGSNGQPCSPGIVVNGEPMTTGDAMPNYDYKISGAGTSTGNALQVHVMNMSTCPLYWFVPAGTIMQPKGFTERVLTGIWGGNGVPNLKDFQKMITFGIFLRLAPLDLVTAEPPVVSTSDTTEPLRSYCVQLHKLAPHPKTEYKFGDEGDQKEYGENLQLLNHVFSLLQTRQIQSQAGHGLDLITQWALWVKIEMMDEKQFREEYEKLVRKNFEAKKEKVDKETEKRVQESEQDLWGLVQAVLK